jgi:hypothetical protein
MLAFQPTMNAMSLPRTVVTPNLLGRTLGAPGDVEAQRRALLAGFDLLQQARSVGAMVDLTDTYHP